MAKILVVEDDYRTRRIVSSLLTAAGHTILEAENGAEGLTVASRERPDLVICDLMMPVMDGMEAVRLMRQEEALANTPVIVLTAVSERKTILEIMEFGISYYLKKPVDLGILGRRVAQILDIERNTKRLCGGDSQSLKSLAREREKPVVLICEPNKVMMSKLVQACGSEYEILQAQDGASCLNTIVQHLPDVVLLEPELHFLSGHEVAVRARDLHSTEGMKIIAFTSPLKTGCPEDQSGCCDYTIEKPFLVDEVLGTIDRILDRDLFKISRSDDRITLKYRSESFSLLAKNPDEASKKMKRMLLRVLGTCRPLITFDLTLVDEGEEEYWDVVCETVWKAAEQAASVVVLTRNEDLSKRIEFAASGNVTVKLESCRRSDPAPRAR